MSTMKTAHAIRHVHFEDLGLLEAILADHGYRHRYWDAGVDDLSELERAEPDLLVVLGGPISVNAADAYPFLWEEFHIVARHIAKGRPVLGICLGAQIIARALGAEVGTMDAKEIGFAPLELTQAGAASVLAPLRRAESVLHWHGEACLGVDRLSSLARTDLCQTQAFASGSKILGLQFHLEARLDTFERWLVGHCSELEGIGADVPAMRAAARHHLPRLEPIADEVFDGWLKQCS